MLCQVNHLVSEFLLPFLHLGVRKHHDLLLVAYLLVLVLKHDNKVSVLGECLLVLQQLLLLHLQVRIELLERLFRLLSSFRQLLHRLLTVPQVPLQLLNLHLGALQLSILFLDIKHGLS